MFKYEMLSGPFYTKYGDLGPIRLSSIDWWPRTFKKDNFHETRFLEENRSLRLSRWSLTPETGTALVAETLVVMPRLAADPQLVAIMRFPCSNFCHAEFREISIDKNRARKLFFTCSRCLHCVQRQKLDWRCAVCKSLRCRQK